MIEHEVIVVGDTLSANITAALLAKKGINVGFVRKKKKRYREIENLWIGPPAPFLELAEVLQLSSRLQRTKGFFVHRNHRTYRLPVSMWQLFSYRYLPFSARLKTPIDLLALNRVEPEKIGACTARDLIETLKFDNFTKSYLLSLGSFITCIPWGGVDAITFFSSLIYLRTVYPEVYCIRPGIEEFLTELEEVYASHATVYEAECTGLAAENNRAIAVFLGDRSIEAKSFVLSTEPYELGALVRGLEHPVIKEYGRMSAKSFDVKIVLKERLSETQTSVVIEDAPLLGVSPSSAWRSGRATTYWRYFIGREERKEEEIERKFRILMAKAFPNFWSNVETIEQILTDVPLPYYKKLPQRLLRNLFLGTRNVYGNNLRDEVRAGIDAFLLSHAYLKESIHTSERIKNLTYIP
ncbi:MAG: hypothetical protein QW115_02500 [Thermoplasmata archaeon]